jgi:mannose-6-phosphate isomerase-like protein (cupin superfamily)
MKAVNIRAVMAKRPTWKTPDGATAFWSGDSFNGGSTWVGRFSGQSPWERHPEGEELLHVLEGEVEVTILSKNGATRRRVAAGSIFVVPRGHWHRQRALKPVLECGATSGRTDYSEAADPRKANKPLRRPANKKRST